MHPILSDKKKIFIYLIVWSAIGILSGFVISSGNETTILYAITFTLPMMLVYGEVNLSAWYLCRAFPLERHSIWRILFIAVVSVMIVSSLWTLLCWAWMLFVEKFFSVVFFSLPIYQTLLIIASVGVQLFLISLAVSYLIVAFEQSREAERSAFELRLLAQNAELKALRMQIDPHFLFNSLNSISALIVSNAELARTMTTTLADFFRKSLQYGAKETISLAEEISLLNHYLDIEKIRFGKRLNVRQYIEPDALPCVLPPLLLQPLIENAIKHGISDSIDGGTVLLSAQKKSNRLFISIENPMEHNSAQKKGAGLGLEIVRKRLHTMYGNDSDVHTAVDGNTFQVILFLPTTIKK